MKRIIIALILISGIQLTAQTQESVRWISKFGLAIGFNPVFVMPDVDPVNRMMPGFGVEKFSDSGFLGFGGSGYVYILLIDNFRIGGMGFSANSSVNGKVAAAGAPGQELEREAEYSLGIGGVTAEYTLPFVKNVAVSVGAIIGAGSMNIKLYQNSGTTSWEEIWGEFNDGSESAILNREIKNSFYTFTPTINVDYPVTRYFAFRAGAGYIFTFGNDWTLNNDQDINNIPSDLKADSFFIQAGVYLGFFAF